MSKEIQNRVDALRKYMLSNGLSAFIVVSSDAHSSEYVADCWKSREWLTGFDGSAGTAVITLADACLWTDSRYWLAAEQSLQGTGITLMKDGLQGTPSITEWLCYNLEQGSVVGVDGLFSKCLIQLFQGSRLGATKENPRIHVTDDSIGIILVDCL